VVAGAQVTLILPLLVVALAVGLGWQLRAWREQRRTAQFHARWARITALDDSDEAGA
jgi:hypothetical protein